MKQLWLGTNPRRGTVQRRCAYRFLLERYRRCPFSSPTIPQRGRTEPLAIDHAVGLAVYLRQRLFALNDVKHGRAVFIAAIALQRLRRNQHICEAAPPVTQPLPSSLRGGRRHPTAPRIHSRTPTRRQSYIAPFGLIRLIAKGKRYTSSERNFYEDSLQKNNSAPHVDSQLALMPGDAQ